MAAALGTLPFSLGRWFAHLSVYQSHLEGLQSPILLDLSPSQSWVKREDWPFCRSLGHTETHPPGNGFTHKDAASLWLLCTEPEGPVGVEQQQEH